MKTTTTNKRLYIQVADAHLKAAQKDGSFDYPKGSTFESIEEVKKTLKEGKTIEEVYYQCIAKYGSITGGLLNHMFSHTSKNTIAAVRKGLKILIG